MKKDEQGYIMDEGQEAAMSPIYSFSEMGYLSYGEDSGALFDNDDIDKKHSPIAL